MAERKSSSQHPPEPSSGAEYAQALVAVMQQDREKAGASKEARPRRSRTTSPPVFLFIVLGGAFAARENYVYTLPPDPPPPEVQQRAGRIMMLSAVNAVERYRTTRGMLPNELTGLQLPRGEWRYERADTGYSIRLALPSTAVSFRSGENPIVLLPDASRARERASPAVGGRI